MAFLCSFFCLVIGLFSFKVDKRLYSPSGLFSTFWAILMFASGLRLYSLYETSEFAYIVVTVGVFCFAFGSLVSYLQKQKYYSNKQVLNKSIFKACLIICLLSLLLNFQVIFRFFVLGFDVHSIYQVMADTVSGGDTEIYSIYNTNLVRLQQFVGYPLLYTLVPISVSEYISTKKRSYIYIAIGLSLLRFLFDFRRTYIVIIVVFLFFFLYIKNRERNGIKQFHLSFKRRFYLISSVCVFFYLFALLSLERKGEDYKSEYSLGSNFYYYYVGSLPYLSQRLDLLSNVDYTYGLTSFRGLAAPIMALLGIAGIDEPHKMTLATKNINDLHNTVLTIGTEHAFNSYATCFFEFFLDGGIFGVILISFLFGLYSRRLFDKTTQLKTNRFICKYAFFLSLFIFLSVLHFNGAVVCYVWPFVIEKFLYKSIAK